MVTARCPVIVWDGSWVRKPPFDGMARDAIQRFVMRNPLCREGTRAMRASAAILGSSDEVTGLADDTERKI